MSLRLTLICHAATHATRQATFPVDEPLEPQGLAKALARASRYSGAAWTSPARRAVQTAEALGLSAVIAPALADIALGVWAGRALAEVVAAEPAGFAAWMTDAAANPHGGESITAMIGRIATWLDGIEGTGKVVAVTHPVVMRAVTVIALDAPPISFWRIDIAPLSVARFQGRAGRWTLQSLDRDG